MGTHYAGTEEEIAALDCYIKLLRALDTVKARIDSETDLGALNGSPFGVLEMLSHLGPLQQQTIAHKLLTSKSNVVALIDKLERRGLVARRRGIADRRCVFVSLTTAGEEQVEALLPGHVTAITKAMSTLTLDEKRQFGALCRKLGLGTAE